MRRTAWTQHWRPSPWATRRQTATPRSELCSLSRPRLLLLGCIVGSALPSAHACRRAKAAFEAYYAEQLEVMKAQKPGLRLMQYKSMIFEKWQRDPRNPRNQKPE